MNLRCLSKSRITLAALCGIGLAGSGVFQARADQWDRKSILTVNQTIQVTDTVLQPGKYVFKLADSSSNRNIVQIFNSDQSHIITTVMAIPARRVQPTDKSEFTFWETPPGTAKALRDWYYPGDYVGQEFRYPKEPYRLAVAQAPAPAPPSQATAEAPPAPAPAPEPPAQPEPQVAQNEPPPPPAPAPEPQAQPAPQPPAELPKTGSPFPLIGLTGLGLLGIGGIIRLKRSLY
jgi:LPXTG-motif cell wall-anchored protein